jgi:uncharacterized protein with PIN domain
MGKANISFLNQLNDFLPRRKKDQVLIREFNGNPSVKHIVESMGVPHTEVGQILVNEQSTNFSYQIQSGDTIIVYPASPDVDHLSGLFHSGKLNIEPRFILDNHLGKLTTYLRILGFDTMYQNDYQDDQLAQITGEEQMIEVLRRFGLTKLLTPFHRCLQCNTPLEPVRKEIILHRLEPLTKKYFNEFHNCPKCDRVYWKGSHYNRMEKLISRLVERSLLDWTQPSL